MRILFIGDIVGRSGRNAVTRRIPALRERWAPDLIIANAENAAAGVGVTPAILHELRAHGVHAFTLGNHAWRKTELLIGIHALTDIVRPANFPEGSPGHGSMVVTLADGRKLGVVNLVGRVYMEPMRCPFLRADDEIAALREKTPMILVDMHAEATSEKAALAWYLDGRCSAVLGTHTHVQTADEWILPKGTAFISDVGMCGPYHSVIGTQTERVVEKFVHATPVKFEVASGPAIFCAVVVDINEDTGRAEKITRVLERDAEH